MTGTVDPAVVAPTVTNTASVTGPTPDPDPTNNAASATTPVTTSANLSLAKTGPADIAAGEQLTWTLVVHNDGPSDAQGDVLTDPLPDGIAVRGTGPDADQGSCVMVGATVSCALGVIPAGASVAVRIPVTVAAGLTAPSVTNTATVTSPTPDPTGDPSGRVGSTTTDVTALADLTMVKTGPAEVVAGTGLTWTLTVSNSGPSVAQDVSVVDEVPAGVTGLAASATHGDCTIDGQTLTCAIGVLAPGDSARITLTVSGTVDPAFTGAELANTATVESRTPEPSSDGDDGRSSTATTAVHTEADLIVTKVPAAAAFVAGDRASWTVTVTNLGPSTATGVAVTDEVPADLQDVTFTDGDGAALDCPGGVCAIGTLAPGGTATVVVSGTVDPDTTAPTIVNRATVAATSPDPVEGNNEVTSTVPLTTLAHLVLEKTGPAEVVAGGQVQWTIEVSNPDGPSTARGVSVTDTLPAGLVDVVVAAPAGVDCPANPSAGAEFTCELPDLPVGGPPLTITVTAGIDAGYLGATLVNTAAAASDTTLTDPDDAADRASATVLTEADLSVVKTGPAGPVTAGTPISWTVTVSNAGPSVARSVVVDDPAPAGTTGLTGTWSGGTCDTPCALGDLEPDATVEITYTAGVDPGYANPVLSNTATVGSATSDPDGSNNTASVPTDITTSADLSLVKSVDPDPLVPGGPVTYTLAVHNDGPSDATGVQVTDQLPAALTDATASSTDGTCAVTDGLVACDLGVLAADGDASVTVTGTLAADVDPGTVTNTASVTATTPDPDLTNNTSTASADTATADLSVTKTASTTFVLPSDPLVYTIDSVNAGPGPARNTVVTDRIPEGTHLIDVTTTQGSCTSEGLLVTCLLGTVPAGEKATVVVTAKVDADRLAPLTNQAAAFSPDDADPSNNLGEVTTEVGAVADLALTKSVTSGPVVAGEQVTWQLQVDNAGPAAATDVVITDAVPASVTGLTAGAGCVVKGGSLTCTVARLEAGDSFRATVSGTLDPAFRGTLRNTATVGSAVPDPDDGNNSATSSSPVGVDSGLTIGKAADVASVVAGGSVTYTITVTQNGPSVSAPATVTEQLPAGATVLASTASQGSYSAGSAVWSVGAVAPGSPATLELQVRLDVTGATTNTVELVESGSDSVETATADVDVTAVPVVPPVVTPPGPLPNTGFPVARVALLGLLLLLAGAGALVLSRRRGFRHLG